MQLTEETLRILKSFSSLNSNLQFQQGNVLRTISPMKAILAKATLSQSFERSFAIFDMHKFLAALSLFDSPELVFGDKAVTITAGSHKLNYVYAASSTVMVAPNKDIPVLDPEVVFSLDTEALQNINKAASALSTSEIAVIGDGNKLYLDAQNFKSDTPDVYTIELGVTDKTFRAVIKTEHLKLIPQAYNVEIKFPGFMHFVNADKNLEYWVALEKSTQPSLDNWGFIMKKFMMGMAFLAMLSTAAFSHSWYPAFCCGDYDCGPITKMTVLPDGKLQITIHIHDEHDGHIMKDEFKTAIFPADMEQKPSKDGDDHACIIENGTPNGTPKCLFIGAKY